MLGKNRMRTTSLHSISLSAPLLASLVAAGCLPSGDPNAGPYQLVPIGSGRKQILPKHTDGTYTTNFIPVGATRLTTDSGHEPIRPADVIAYERDGFNVIRVSGEGIFISRQPPEAWQTHTEAREQKEPLGRTGSGSGGGGGGGGGGGD